MEELMKRMKGSAKICMRHGQATMEGYLYVQEKCEFCSTACVGCCALTQTIISTRLSVFIHVQETEKHLIMKA